MVEPSEMVYLKKYREMLAKQKRIDAIIVDLRGICESAKEWRKTAYALASSGDARLEWSDIRLQGIVSLKAEMINYHKLTLELANLWEGLSPAEKEGLIQQAP